MKRNLLKKILPLIFIIPTLFSCKKEVIYDDFTDNYQDKLPSFSQDGLTFHAFNWTFNQIKENLPSIVNSGFKNILTMPVQEPKNGGSSWRSFYQPLSFSIAKNSSLGSKDDLKNLCEEAEKYDISILVDIVANHMANITDEDLEDDGTPKVSPSVEEYEPILYQNRNEDVDGVHGITFHHNKNAISSGAETQYYQYGELPDLNTSNPYVQERVLSLLKECIDVGVDGFRFDTAKHIETEDDPSYPSDFWINTLDVAKVYYKNKTGNDLYAYGEILNTPLDRSIDLYTKRMLITDDGYCDQFASSIYNGNVNKIIDATYKVSDVKKEIAWVESHDEYTSSSSHMSNFSVSKLWAILASRKDLGGLYLARPNEDLVVGQIGSYYFENEFIATANRFHNRFVGANEFLSVNSNESIFINERVSSSDSGAFLINLSKIDGEKTVEVSLPNLEDGNYYDALTNNKVVVTSHKGNVKFSSSGMVYLLRSNKLPHPYFTISEREGSFVDDKEIKVTIQNYEEAYFTYNDETIKNKLEDSNSISLKGHCKDDGSVTINLFIKNKDFSISRSFTYHKISLIEGYFNVINLNPKYLTDYEVYIWSWEPSKWSKNYKIQDGRLLINTNGMTGFLIGLFEKGYEIKNIDVWDSNVVKQSSDIKGTALSLGFYDASNF